MYVCLCHGVTDTDIKNAAKNGVTTVKDLRCEFKLGSQCGKCCPHAHEILKESEKCPGDEPPTKI